MNIICIFLKSLQQMSKNKDQIGITINKDINDKLDKDSINKSKLINSLLCEWIKDKKNIKDFTKKSD